MSAAPRTLVLVPTDMERRILADQPDFGRAAPWALCGFGPVAAGARTARLLTMHNPRRVVLVGIAGTFDRDTLPIGGAAVFRRVVMHGVGIGSGSGFVPAGEIGLQHWPGDAGTPAVGDALALTTPVPAPAGPLLTCCAASASTDDARQRQEQYPGAAAEDMEGFAVALACRLAGVPLVITRGMSNDVGDRQHDQWRIREALDAAWLLARDLVSRPDWGTA